MSYLLDDATREVGIALLSKDYAKVNDILYQVHSTPFFSFTRVTKLVVNVFDAFGDSLFLNQANVLYQLASQLEPDVTQKVGLNYEFFVYNELLSGEVYPGLETMLDYLMDYKTGLYLSHKALVAVMLKHPGLDLKYSFIPDQQEAKEYIIKTLDIDLPTKLVVKATERYAELSSSMYYDYLMNLRYALLHCTAYDIFKDMSQEIVDNVKNTKLKDDVCLLWIQDLIEALSDPAGMKPSYSSFEEEMIAQAYTEIPPLILYAPEDGKLVEYTFDIPIVVAYRLGMVTLHPAFEKWFQQLKGL